MRDNKRLDQLKAWRAAHPERVREVHRQSRWWRQDQHLADYHPVEHAERWRLTYVLLLLTAILIYTPTTRKE
jgi:hypothetical protein